MHAASPQRKMLCPSRTAHTKSVVGYPRERLHHLYLPIVTPDSSTIIAGDCWFLHCLGYPSQVVIVAGQRTKRVYAR
jgi:hypothetical protein